MCKITKENDSLQRQTENKDEDSQELQCNKNIPELRFPEFEGEWITYKLCDVVTRIIRKNKNLETKRPLTISAKYGLIDQIEFFDKYVASKNLKGYYLLKKGEFAYNKSYSNGFPYGAVKRLDLYNQGAISTLYICFEITNKINSNFLKIYFDSNKWNKEMYKIAVEGARNHGLLNIPINDFFNTKHLFPSISEQEKIADFLSAIDKKIGFMEKKHTLYKNIKKYFLDNLFPHEKRDIPDLSFKEYSNIWKQIKLKQIIYKAKAGGTPKSSIKEYYNGNIPFLSINDMTNEGKYITYTEKSITEKGLKNSSAWLVPEKSLLYSMYASVGFVSINNIPLTTSQAIFNIIFKEHVSLEFMYYYLTFYKQYLHRYIETGTQGNLNAKLIKNFKIKIPSKEEQRKIADFLSLIDTYIEINKEKVIQVKQFKKGLLQKMFC